MDKNEDIDTAAIADTLAREVMGWQDIMDWWCDKDGNPTGYVVTPEDEEFFDDVTLWNPCADVSQMEMCWRRMEDEGYNTATHCNWNFCGSRIYHRAIFKQNEMLPVGEVTGREEALVGCQVMIAALNAEKESDD